MAKHLIEILVSYFAHPSSLAEFRLYSQKSESKNIFNWLPMKFWLGESRLKKFLRQMQGGITTNLDIFCCVWLFFVELTRLTW